MNYFAGVDMFSGLSEEDQQQLSSFCQLQSFKDGERIFSQGDEAQAMYLLSSGKLSVIKNDNPIAQIGVGQIFGEIAFLEEGTRRNASVIADGDVEIITLIRFSVDQMFAKSPDLHERIKEIIKFRLAV